MTAEIAAALQALSQVNPWAAGGAVLCLAGVVGIILFGRTRQVFSDLAEEEQRGAFRAQLLAELQAMRKREDDLRGEIAALRDQNARLSEALSEQRVQIELLREQTRRLIEALKAVRDGALAPAQIALPEARG